MAIVYPRKCLLSYVDNKFYQYDGRKLKKVIRKYTKKQGSRRLRNCKITRVGTVWKLPTKHLCVLKLKLIHNERKFLSYQEWTMFINIDSVNLKEIKTL